VDFPKVRSELAAALERQANCRFLFDAVFVDEGQDLDGAAYRILLRVSAHITVCTDPNQQIYDNGSSDADIARWLGISPSRVAFLDAFRCSPLVSQLASLYLAPGYSRDVFLRQVRQQQGEREMPVLFVAVSHEQERERLVRIVKTRLAKGEKVGVLVPSKSFMTAIREEANHHGVGVSLQAPEQDERTNLSILTYHSAKGLVFDSVLLPHVWEGALRHGDSDAWERLLFVGITRARKWVYISTVSPSDRSLFTPLVRLLTERVVEVQWASELASAQPRAEGRLGGSLRDLV
jgi:superfamily I DNA/RNA helicase